MICFIYLLRAIVFNHKQVDFLVNVQTEADWDTKSLPACLQKKICKIHTLFGIFFWGEIFFCTKVRQLCSKLKTIKDF